MRLGQKTFIGQPATSSRRTSAIAIDVPIGRDRGGDQPHLQRVPSASRLTGRAARVLDLEHVGGPGTRDVGLLSR